MNSTSLQRLFLEITTQCNLRCNLCKLWEQKDPQHILKLKDKINFLKEFVKWQEDFNENYQNFFRIILTGGEPFLYSDQVFEIAKFCKDNDITCYINTNGSLIGSKVRKILNSGLTALTISIDSHNAKTHDYLRGSSGLFDYLIKVIKKLKSRKKKNKYTIKLCVQSILGGWNINSLPAHIKFFRELGLDGIMFQPIQYPFGFLIPSNWYKNYDKFPDSYEDIQNNIDYLLKSKHDNGFIMNSREEIELWQYYFNDPEYLPDSINPCKSFEQNLIIDVCGNVKFCFNREIEPPNKIGNILTTSIDELWNGKMALKEKKEMSLCIRACGIMACHINVNLREQ